MKTYRVFVLAPAIATIAAVALGQPGPLQIRVVDTIPRDFPDPGIFVQNVWFEGDRLWIRGLASPQASPGHQLLLVTSYSASRRSINVQLASCRGGDLRYTIPVMGSIDVDRVSGAVLPDSQPTMLWFCGGREHTWPVLYCRGCPDAGPPPELREAWLLANRLAESSEQRDRLATRIDQDLRELRGAYGDEIPVVRAAGPSSSSSDGRYRVWTERETTLQLLAEGSELWPELGMYEYRSSEQSDECEILLPCTTRDYRQDMAKLLRQPGVVQVAPTKIEASTSDLHAHHDGDDLSYLVVWRSPGSQRSSHLEPQRVWLFQTDVRRIRLAKFATLTAGSAWPSWLDAIASGWGLDEDLRWERSSQRNTSKE